MCLFAAKQIVTKLVYFDGVWDCIYEECTKVCDILKRNFLDKKRTRETVDV